MLTRRALLGFALALGAAVAEARTAAATPASVLLPSAAPEPPAVSAAVVHSAASEFNRRVFVVDRNGLRAMRFGSLDAVDQTRIRPGHPEQLPMPYLRTAALGLAVPDPLRRMLMVGLGGGAFARYVGVRLPAVHIDAVEIDPVVARIARDYFAFEESDRLRLHVMDAVDFMQRNTSRYDYILLDAYDADELPEALLTRAFLRNIRVALARGGVVVANIAVGSDRRARGIIRRLAASFEHCLHMRSTPSYNDVLLLARSPLPDAAGLDAWATQFEADSPVGMSMRIHAGSAQLCRRAAR